MMVKFGDWNHFTQISLGAEDREVRWRRSPENPRGKPEFQVWAWETVDNRTFVSAASPITTDWSAAYNWLWDDKSWPSKTPAPT